MTAAKADTLYAWVTTLSDGEVNIVGVLTALGHTPMVFADLRVAQNPRCRQFARSHARGLKQPVRLVRFGAIEVLETIEP